MDPDKKVEEAKRQRKGVYQSSKHPEHFENEGGEYITQHPNEKGPVNADEDVLNRKPKEVRK